MTDGPHDFSMQARHGAPNDFRHSRHIRIGRIGVSTAETDEAAFSFACFGGSKRLVEFFCQRRRHRAAANCTLREKTLPGSMKSRLVVRAPISTTRDESVTSL